jgi:hypothetical protein
VIFFGPSLAIHGATSVIFFGPSLAILGESFITNKALLCFGYVNRPSP